MSKEIYLNQISAAINKRNFGAAENTCRLALKIYPEDDKLETQFAYIAQQTQRHQLALDILRRMVGSGVLPPEAAFIAGLCNYELANFQDAAKAFRTAFDAVPHSWHYAKWAIDVAGEIGDLDAVDYIYSAFRSHSDNRSVMKSYAAALFAFDDARRLEALASQDDCLRLCELKSVQSWAHAAGCSVLNIGEPEHIQIMTPSFLSHQGIKSGSPLMTAVGNSPYVAELTNVTAFSRSACIRTWDGTLIEDNSTRPDFGAGIGFTNDPLVVKRRGNRVLIDTTSFKQRRMELGVWLGGAYSTHFGHWVPDFLGKLYMLDQHPEFANMPILVDDGMPESHYDYLRVVISNQIIRVPLNTAIHCKTLLVAPTPTFQPWQILNGEAQHQSCLSPNALRYLRQRIESRNWSKSTFGERIFLSRRNMQWRRIENEPELVDLLLGEGFNIVEIENLNFAEQVSLFRDARVIVAANGSSLLNLIFAPMNIELIVLSQPNMFNWGGFNGPMRDLGFDPLFVLGEQTVDYKHADYRIPPELLRLALRRR